MIDFSEYPQFRTDEARHAATEILDTLHNNEYCISWHNIWINSHTVVDANTWENAISSASDDSYNIADYIAYSAVTSNSDNYTKSRAGIRDALISLISHPESAGLLRADLSHVLMLIKLGNIPAILMYTANAVFRRHGL